MGELEDLKGREELIAWRKRLDDLADSQERHEENRTPEDRKISKIKTAILSGKVQLPPALKNASLAELMEYVEKSRSNPPETDGNP